MTQSSRRLSDSVLCVFPVTPLTCNANRCALRSGPSSNSIAATGPIRFTLANKGVGPAIIKHVVVRVDDQPVKNWADVLQKILGPGYHPGEESDMSGRVFAAGESMNVFTPHDDAQNPIPFDKSNPLWAKLDTGRSRVTVEICYCSTVGECWTLRGGGLTPSTTTQTRRCPTASASSFQQ